MRIIRTTTVMMLLLWSGFSSANHLNVTYSGNIDFILADDGTGMFSGTGVGDIVTNIFNYGVNDSSAVITSDSPGITGETDYLFTGSPYSSHVSSATASTGTNDANIVMSNDNPISVNPPDTTGLAELSSLAGFTINQGAPFDGWSTEASIGNLTYGATIFSFTDLNWTSDESYIPVPSNTGDIMAFFISETNAAGDLIYFALGEVDNLTFTAVPLPAAFWLFGSGLLGLIGIARGNKAAS